MNPPDRVLAIPVVFLFIGVSCHLLSAVILVLNVRRGTTHSSLFGVSIYMYFFAVVSLVLTLRAGILRALLPLGAVVGLVLLLMVFCHIIVPAIATRLARRKGFV